MRIPKLAGFAFVVSVAAPVLVGCGGPSLNGVSSLLPQSILRGPVNRIRSWMRPGATSGDLMYVADAKDSVVDVYTYPTGTLAGTLTGFEGLAFICTDGKGDVFIPSYGAAKIFEFAHGGTSPIRTLSDPRALPYSCSVDAKTGNLAVSNYSLENYASGNVVIYQHAKGKPQVFTPYDQRNEYSCAYDNAGNLFVEGAGPFGSKEDFTLEELVKGARLFSPVTLQNVPAYPNGLQWSGGYLAMGTGTVAGPSSGDTYIYHVSVSDFVARTIGVTRVKEHGPTANFYIDGSTVLVTGGEGQPNVSYFPYPAGGAPSQTVTQTFPYGVVVSAGQRHETSGYQYSTIFSFEGFNGAAPQGSLLYYKGKLYGTTAAGGYYSQGTVFSVTPSGEETVLHNFGQPGDGSKPEAGLAVLNSVLYGTTYAGGSHGNGTVFSITPTGNERVTYSFGSRAGDGKNPIAGVTPLGSVLYGTAPYGGSGNAGTVFRVTTAGNEKTIFYFPDYSKKDGMNPFSGLTAYNGKLYGTTATSGPCLEGTVYSVTTSGNEHTLYGFPCQRYDGSNPEAGLVVVNGVLYGTTTQGGKAFYNDGTVFSLTLSGQEQVLFDFIPSSEFGFRPDTTLLAVNGALYGTTPESAANNVGAIYSVPLSGQPIALHEFGIAPDGSTSLGGLIDVRGTLYGTTSAGGGPANAGTVYRITP